MPPATVYCDHCRAANGVIARFCTSCGRLLSAVASPHPPAAQVPVLSGYWENFWAELAARPRPPAVSAQYVLCTYRGHRAQVSTVAWSLDGRRIASASADTTVQVWQVP